MSELKAKHVVDVYDAYSSNPYNEAQVYLKSEVDKVIAELKETLNNSRNARKYWRKEYLIEYKEIRHQKHKRCLAMAKWCERKRVDAANYRIPREKWEFYEKWHKRYLAIADKFKEEA